MNLEQQVASASRGSLLAVVMSLATKMAQKCSDEELRHTVLSAVGEHATRESISAALEALERK